MCACHGRSGLQVLLGGDGSGQRDKDESVRPPLPDNASLSYGGGNLWRGTDGDRRLFECHSEEVLRQ